MLDNNDEEKYAYGFGGQQISDEINANSYTAQFWQYDARTGRRLNLDPIDQFSISNYAAFANNPIVNSDVLGDKVQFGISEKFSDKFRIFKSVAHDYLTDGDFRTRLNSEIISREILHIYEDGASSKITAESPKDALGVGNNIKHHKFNPYQDALTSNIEFRGNSDIITNDNGNLSTIAAFAAANPDRIITIHGATPGVNTSKLESYNIRGEGYKIHTLNELTVARAQTIADALINNYNIPPDRIKVGRSIYGINNLNIGIANFSAIITSKKKK